MLRQVHQGYLGIDKCQLRAQQVPSWPNINPGIENRVPAGVECERHRFSNTKETLIYKIPKLQVLTYLTGMVVASSLEYTTTANLKFKGDGIANITKETKAVFPKYGIPEKGTSDNGLCYSSRQYVTFAKEYDFKHVTYNPRYLCCKLILIKAKETNSDPYL